MKKVNVTFSIPPEIHKLLKSLIGQRKMSSFVAEAIKKALEQKKRLLEHAYIEAEQDKATQKELKDWDALDVEDWE